MLVQNSWIQSTQLKRFYLFYPIFKRTNFKVVQLCWLWFWRSERALSKRMCHISTICNTLTFWHHGNSPLLSAYTDHQGLARTRSYKKLLNREAEINSRAEVDNDIRAQRESETSGTVTWTSLTSCLTGSDKVTCLFFTYSWWRWFGYSILLGVFVLV